MNNLLIFFALPIATILLSIVLQRVLNNPALVGMTFFAIYLIITYAFFDSNFLILTFIYSILAYLSAVISCIICSLISRLNDDDIMNCFNGCSCNNRRCNNEIIKQLIPEQIIDNETNENDKKMCNKCYRYRR